MKIKIVLLMILTCFLVSCGSDDEEEDTKNTSNESQNGTTEEDNDYSLSDPVVNDSEAQQPDEDADTEPDSFCYAGGALLYEGEQQFISCAEDPEKFQKQLCKNGKWVDKGGCISGTVEITSGSFKMGCDRETEGSCPEDAVPVHEVELSTYVMDKFEVSVELFQKCIDENVCTNDNAGEPHYRTSSDSYQCNIGNPDRKNHPANCVTWYGAKAYCEWLGKRLPTEAEWEKAAKSGKTQIYPWGNTPSASCGNNVMRDENKGRGCGNNTTFPIGSRPEGASAQWVYDLSGNVAEYTSDWYERNFYSTDEAAQKDTGGPKEPEKDKYKVIRGGSFIYGEDHARSSFRSSGKLDDPATDFGFRCVYLPK